MLKFVLIMLMLLLYMYMLMEPPVWSGLQLQVTRLSSSSPDVVSPPIRLLAAFSSPTNIEKNVSYRHNQGYYK